MSPQADVFTALADPTRREILAEVTARGSATATELAGRLPITRQAVSKHLAVLADAHLVDAARVGRETRYRPTPEPLDEAVAWMGRLGALQRAAAKRR